MFLLNNKFIIDWTPKAGCTTVTKMVFGEMGILEEAMQYSEWIHDFRGKLPQIYPNLLASSSQLLSKDYIKIKVVRNPYLRAVSSFLDASLNATTHNYKVGGEFINVSFLEFLNLYKRGELVDVHWKPQYKDIESEFDFDEIVQLENMNIRIDEVNKKYNLNFKVNSHSSHHRKKDNSKTKFVGTTKYRDIVRDNNDTKVPTYDNFYNFEIKNLVYEIYEKDFEVYGYDRNCEI